jgi:flagellar hook protein FlgE
MSALGASISGLQSSQKWLDVISNNISNSNTVAYKEGRLSFADLISSSVTDASAPDSTANQGGINPSQLGLGVTVGSIQTIMTQGAIQTTGNATDVAINGAGFLTVKAGQNTLYTRAGNLAFDQVGNLTTASGGLVQGWEMQTTVTNQLPAVGGAGVPAGADAELTIVGNQLNTSNTAAIGNIVIPSNLVLAPQATSYSANSSVKDQGVILSGNLDSHTPQNAVPAMYPPVAGPANGFVPDATQSFTAYDSLGNAHQFLVSWCQTANTGAGAAAVWKVDVNEVTGAQTPNGDAWVAGGPGNLVAQYTGVTFNADGSLATLGAVAGGAPITGTIAGTTYDIDLPLTNGAVGPGAPAGTPEFNFSINIGTPNNAGVALGLRDGMTGDYGNGSTNTLGVYTPVQTATTKFVSGYPEGTLTGVSFNTTGGIVGNFSNGQTLVVAQLAMSTFSNPTGLSSVGGNMFAQTDNSGIAQIQTAGANGAGTIQGGALESSNVDLTVELTNMILAQRMFESNAKVITTSSSLLSTLINAVPAQ